MMFTTKNPGDASIRFVTAMLPARGRSRRSAASSSTGRPTAASSASTCARRRCPAISALYYQNDFFGSDTSQMQYRLQHFYGQYYGLVAGFTYGVFEDPDSWPDTVDYEGPNALIFARRPLVHYIHELDQRLEHHGRPGGAEPRHRHHRRRRTPASTDRRPTAASTSAGRRATSATCSSARSSARSRVRGDDLGDDNVVRLGRQPRRLVQRRPAATPCSSSASTARASAGSATTRASTTPTPPSTRQRRSRQALTYASGLGALTHNWTPQLAVDGDLRLRPRRQHEHAGAERLPHDPLRQRQPHVPGLQAPHRSASRACTGSARCRAATTPSDVVRVNLGLVYSPFD